MNLIKSTGTFGFYTIISRILGYLRDILIAIFLGTSFIADAFFVDRYGHRAVVLETVAGVPGMVAGVLMHFKSLRSMKTGYGASIREMLAEAENERMHLMFFIEIAKPNFFERFLVLLAQAIFGLFYFIMYIFFTRTAHRMIGYFEDEAVKPELKLT